MGNILNVVASSNLTTITGRDETDDESMGGTGDKCVNTAAEMIETEMIIQRAKMLFPLKCKLQKMLGGHRSELNEYVNLYSNPEQIFDFFFDTYSLANRLRDDWTGEVQKLRVKLVCIDLEGWQDRKILGFIAANLYSMAGFLDYGLVHVGIQLGSWVVHWFNDSLVHITTTKATRPNCAIDIGSLDLEDDSDVEKIQNMCSVITRYNIEMTYNNYTNNCHKFTNEIIESLGFPTLEFKGQLGDYMRKLKRGPVKAKLYMDPLTNETHDLSSHVVLDLYCRDLFERFNGVDVFMDKYPHDYALLKSWDRGYWLGHLKDKFQQLQRSNMNMVYIPMYVTLTDDGSEECHCPFSDPTESGSMLLSS